MSPEAEAGTPGAERGCPGCRGGAKVRRREWLWAKERSLGGWEAPLDPQSLSNAWVVKASLGTGIGFPSGPAKAGCLLGSDTVACAHAALWERGRRPAALQRPRPGPFSLIPQATRGAATTGSQAKAPVPPSPLHPG